MGFFKQLVEVVFGGANDNRNATTTSLNIQPKALVVNSSNLIKSMEFSATMQLRTPLRVLKRHAEIHSDASTEPPKIAKELWEGVWVPQVKTWREMGVDINEISESSMASNIGQIKASEYLPFLISVRELVELFETTDKRIEKLRNKEMSGNWKSFVSQHGGIEKIIDEFFPRFIDTIPKATSTIIDGLAKLGIVTAYGIESATDETLMGISGLGAAKLQSIRDYCAGMLENSHAIRLDKVAR